jgi:fucose permease
MSLGISANIVGRFGPKRSAIAGLTLIVLGLALFVRSPVGGVYVTDVLPAMLILALGGGTAFLPLILIAVGEASPRDSGLVSGLVSTSQQVGGAIGLAVLASAAAMRTGPADAFRGASAAALNDGYHAAFLIAALLAAVGLALATRLPDTEAPAPGSA